MNFKIILAITAIFILEFTALIVSVDGYLLGAAIAAIAGLGGWSFGRYRRKK